MQIILNGKPEIVNDRMTAAALVQARGLAVTRVAVEINEDVIPRRLLDETPLHDGDRVEIVTFVGGG